MVTIDSSTTIISGIANTPLDYAGLQNSENSYYGIVPCPMDNKFSYSEPATGAGVSGISTCRGLPFGLFVNPSSGIITGEARVIGNYYADLYTIKKDSSASNGSLIKKISQISFTKGLGNYNYSSDGYNIPAENTTTGSIDIFLRDDGKFNVSADIKSCLDFDLSLSDRSPTTLFQYLQPFIARGCLDGDDAEIIIGLLQQDNIEDFIVFQGGYGSKVFYPSIHSINQGAQEATVYSGSPGIICLTKSGEVKSIGFKGSSPVINAVKNIPNNARSGVKKIVAYGWTIIAIKNDGTLVPWGGYAYRSYTQSRSGGYMTVCDAQRPNTCGVWSPSNTSGWPWQNCGSDSCPCRCPKDQIRWVEYPSYSDAVTTGYYYDTSGIIRNMPSNLQLVTSVTILPYAAVCVAAGVIRAWGDMTSLATATNWSTFIAEAAGKGPYTKVVSMSAGFVALTQSGKIVSEHPVLKQWASILNDKNIKVLDILENGIIQLDNGYSIVWFDPYVGNGPGLKEGEAGPHSCFIFSLKSSQQSPLLTAAVTPNLSLPLTAENGAIILPFKVRELSTLGGQSYLLSEGGGFPNFYFCGSDPKWLVKQKVLFKISKGFADIDPAKPFVERPDNNIIVNAAENFRLTLTKRADELDIYNDLTLVDFPRWTLQNKPNWMSIDANAGGTYWIKGTPPIDLVGSSVSFTLKGEGIRNGQIVWSKTHQLSLNVITAKPLFNAPQQKYNFTIGWDNPISKSITILNPEDTISVKPATVLPPGFTFTYDTNSGIGTFGGSTRLVLGTTSIRLKAEGTGGSSTAIVEFEITYGAPVITPSTLTFKNRRPVVVDLHRFVTNAGSYVAVKDWSCEDADLYEAGLSLKRKEGILTGVVSTQKTTIELDMKATSYAGDIISFTVFINIEPAPVMWGLSETIVVGGTVGEYFERPIPLPPSDSPSSMFVQDLPTGLTVDFQNQKIKGVPEVEGTMPCPVSSTYRALDVAVSPSGLSAVVLYDNTVVTWNAYTGEYVATPADATSVVSVAAGSKSIIALKKDGTVISWGYSGLLKLPTNASSGVVGVSAYGNTFAALKDSGEIAVWDFGNESQSVTISAPTVGKRKKMSMAKYYIIVLNSEGLEAFPLKGDLCIDPKLSNQKPFIVQTDESSYFSDIAVGSECMFALRNNGKAEVFYFPVPRYNCLPDCCFVTSYAIQNQVFGDFSAAGVAAVGKTTFMVTEQNKLVVGGDPSLYPKDLSMPIRFLKIVGAREEPCSGRGCPKPRGSIGIILGENGSLIGIGSVVIPAFLFSDSSNSIIFDIAPKPPDNRLINNGKWMSVNGSGDKVAMLEDVSLKNDPSRSKKVSFFSFDTKEMKWSKDGFFENMDPKLVSNSSVSISENGKRIIIGGNRNN